jgi:hypothetical protein
MALKHRKHALHQFIFTCQLVFCGGVGMYGLHSYLDRDISKKPVVEETIKYDVWVLLMMWLKRGKKD